MVLCSSPSEKNIPHNLFSDGDEHNTFQNFSYHGMDLTKIDEGKFKMADLKLNVEVGDLIAL